MIQSAIFAIAVFRAGRPVWDGKTDKRSTLCVDDMPQNDPSSCRVGQMRTINGGVFRLINSTLHIVSSKVTGKLVVSLQPF